MPERENHHPGGIDTIDDAIRRLQDFPIRRQPDLGHHTTLLLKSFERLHPLEQSIEPTHRRAWSILRDVRHGLQRPESIERNTRPIPLIGQRRVGEPGAQDRASRRQQRLCGHLGRARN